VGTALSWTSTLGTPPTPYASAPAGGVYQWVLSNGSLYLDSAPNAFTRAHFAFSYNPNFVNPNYALGFLSSNLFFDEAYATFYNGGAFYARVGRQYLNFGSVLEKTITQPVTTTLTDTVATAVNIGAVNLGGGFFVDGSVFNGTPVDPSGLSTTPTNSAYQAHGYSGEFGYSYFINGAEYGTFFADYLSNFSDVLSLAASQSFFSQSGVVPTKAIPAYSIGGNYNYGPLSFTGTYVTASGSYDASQWQFNNEGAKPSAYTLEADMMFMSGKYPSMVMVSTGGTSDALGMTTPGMPVPVPLNRLLIDYAILPVDFLDIQFEYDRDQDYSGADVATLPASFGNPVTRIVMQGTGQADNIFTLAMKLKI
jgi:hypothetical protein